MHRVYILLSSTVIIFIT